MTSYLFTGGPVLDPRQGVLREGLEVLVEGGRIREVSDTPIRSPSAERVELRGRTLMPGLIDAHVHVIASQVDLAANAMQPSSLATLRAAKVMRGMLLRGFTTVRDVGGADAGLAQAVEEGLVESPRLVVCGKALSQTGGHADLRPRFDDRPGMFAERVGALGRVCDGVDAVRQAARQELRAGAQFIKVMANGGVASPSDPIHALGYSREELIAIVEEAANFGTYVSAHLYTDAAIRRAVECGIHSLEHCNMITAETAGFAAEKGAVAVPTLVTYEALAREGASLGLKPDSVAKIETVRRSGLESLSIMREAGLAMAYGSDLLGEMHKYQLLEFELRGRVMPAAEVIASATIVAAKLCGLEGEVGEIIPGASADLLVIEGDPLRDLGLLHREEGALKAILREGRFVHRID
ncbi:amidohydrolase family protein [Pseudoroseomonas cervicalis]|uniref:metal-dependent hydrolase family protein n=1 Tax=Teichococcus cervicalis TaxID=204525 RepID=UPI002787A7B6|nr:amidohydrolase family protein [Pseudoroseomonas cervicalis]MDQ1077707.1 imidazolonepropionase-like amidohydrolase [Pseudoroseomonas cervicalis]